MNLISKFYQTLKTPGLPFRNIIIPALAAGALLLIPLFAELFVEGMEWSTFDFAAAWVLFFGAGFTYRLISGKSNSFKYRTAAGVMVGSVLFLIWANLAVGLIGSEDNDANTMYLGVIALGLIGSVVARLKAHKMSNVLFLMASAMGVIAVIAIMAGLGEPENSPREIITVNAFFIVLFSVSALLFRQAGQEMLQSKAEREQ